MNILALDTSSQVLIVAVKTDTYYEESATESRDFKHSERLMNVVLEILSHAGLKTSDIDLFACTRGPGSFTGLRIGMATLKGIAYGCEKPLVSVSTLEMWAKTIPHFDGVVVPVIDAKKQRWYLSAFECKNSETKRLCPDIDGNIEDVESYLKNKDVLLVGPDKNAFAAIAEGHCSNLILNYDDSVSPAMALIEKAVEQFKVKGADDIGQGPVYLRKSDAEIALEESNGR